MRPVNDKGVDINAIQDLILRWNIDFPIDRWWRKLHDVSFNSHRHREISFIDMFIEWEEETIYNKLNTLEEEKYIPNTGNFMKKKVKENQGISDEAFNNIDLDKL